MNKVNVISDLISLILKWEEELVQLSDYKSFIYSVGVYRKPTYLPDPRLRRWSDKPRGHSQCD